MSSFNILNTDITQLTYLSQLLSIISLLILLSYEFVLEAAVKVKFKSRLKAYLIKDSMENLPFHETVVKG